MLKKAHKRHGKKSGIYCQDFNKNGLIETTYNQGIILKIDYDFIGNKFLNVYKPNSVDGRNEEIYIYDFEDDKHLISYYPNPKYPEEKFDYNLDFELL